MTILPSTEQNVHHALLHSAAVVPLQLSCMLPVPCRGKLTGPASAMAKRVIAVARYWNFMFAVR